MAVSVSIIVPCYNVAPYVDACMDSLVRQTLRDIEIICVNDGSTDGTPVLLHAWEERDSRVRVIDRENGGLSVARNTGMELASGEYIGFVDPDDSWNIPCMPVCWKKPAGMMRRSPDVVILVFPMAMEWYWRNGAGLRLPEWKKNCSQVCFMRIPFGRGWAF